ncbi:MAG: cytochrome C biogenesis protein [Variibacter sp.]|nr:cytochrome C biogenesis protein [Variibacter sp.]
MKALVFLSAAAAIALLAPAGSRADQTAHSEVRLLAGGSRDVGGAKELRSGIRIRLQPGWKTYWRYPGDSGVPPRFDFSRSRNLKHAAVMWPAPVRFDDGGGTSIGYARQVIFPLRVTPVVPNQPVMLHLKLDYGLCEQLCIPAEAELELQLPADGGVADPELLASEGRVPQPLALGAAGPLAIVSVKQERAGRPRIIVDVRVPEGAALDLFAEGPTVDWSLPLPQPIAGAPEGLRRFAFDVDGAPPGAQAEPDRITLTAVTAAQAIETVIALK